MALDDRYPLSDKKKNNSSSGEAAFFQKIVIRAIYTLAAFLCVTALAFISLISLDAAVLTGTVMALTGFYFTTRNNNQKWGGTLQKQMKEVCEYQNTLSQDLAKNTQDIKKLRIDLAKSVQDINVRIEEFQSSSARPNAYKPPPPSYPAAVESPIIPVKLKGQSTEKATPAFIPPVAANDETILDDDESLSDIVVRELVHLSVQKKHIEVFLQPILRLPQRQVAFYEVFARIRAKAGVYLPASRYLKFVQEENLQAKLDNLLLLHSLDSLKDISAFKGHAAAFFINIHPKSLKDREFMQTLLLFLSRNRTLASRLVLEMPQKIFPQSGTPEHKILDSLTKLGVTYSLDQIRTIPTDIMQMQRDKIRFVKIRTEIFLRATQLDKNFSDITRQKRKLEANGISVIAERIEQEKDLLELLDYNIAYGQGHLFGRPDLRAAYMTKNRA